MTSQMLWQPLALFTKLMFQDTLLEVNVCEAWLGLHTNGTAAERGVGTGASVRAGAAALAVDIPRPTNGAAESASNMSDAPRQAPARIAVRLTNTERPPDEMDAATPPRLRALSVPRICPTLRVLQSDAYAPCVHHSMFRKS
jgi:hypothetical protein